MFDDLKDGPIRTTNSIVQIELTFGNVDFTTSAEYLNLTTIDKVHYYSQHASYTFRLTCSDLRYDPLCIITLHPSIMMPSLIFHTC